MLKFPPIKQPKISTYFVYKIKSKNTGAFIYKMFNRQGNFVGEMTAYPETIHDLNRQFSPNADSYRSFYIKRLNVFDRHKGAGRAFINIARKESLRNFCLGNIHLISSARMDMENPPHIFYRKMGFLCSKYFKLIEKYLDECIQNHTRIEKGKCPLDIPMYIEKDVDLSGKKQAAFYEMKIKFHYLF